MTLKEARALRDEIRQWNDIHCTVPNGHGPDGYFARIGSGRETGVCQNVDFHSRADWLAWKQKAEAEDAAAERKLRPLSPIERMIDQACGYVP